MTEAPRRKIVKTLELSEPIHDAGETITKLEFGKPKARIFRLIESTSDIGGAQILAIIADLCQIGEEAVDEIDWADVEKAAAIVGELLQPKKKGRPRSGSKTRKAGAKR